MSMTYIWPGHATLAFFVFFAVAVLGANGEIGEEGGGDVSGEHVGDRVDEGNMDVDDDANCTGESSTKSTVVVGMRRGGR